MDLNPFDDIADAAQGAGNAILKKKRRLVKYIAKKTTPPGPSIATGQTDRLPKYNRGGGRMLGRKR